MQSTMARPKTQNPLKPASWSQNIRITGSRQHTAICAMWLDLISSQIFPSMFFSSASSLLCCLNDFIFVQVKVSYSAYRFKVPEHIIPVRFHASALQPDLRE